MTSKLAIQSQRSAPWLKEVVVAGKQGFHLLVMPPERDPFDGAARSFGRCWIGGDGVEAQYVAQGSDGADSYFARCLPFYRSRSYIWAWQGPNEPYVKTAKARLALVAFTLRWTYLMRREGLRCVAGAFSNGTPEVNDRQAIVELAPLFFVADYNMVHEYGAPTMQTESAWNTLRHRKLHDMLVDMWPNRAMPPWIIGETGIDGGALAPTPRPEKGWKTFAKDWPTYFDQLQWYDSELQKDSYIERAFLFGTAMESKWRDFEVNEQQCRDIAAYTAVAYGGGDNPTPIPPIEPGGRIILPLVNIGKAWYTADARFGPYDGHPERARDWNLETGGDSDYGEPLQAPCNGSVVYSADAGGGHGIVISFVAMIDGQLVNWHWKHLSRSDMWQWQQVKQGEIIGAIGNAGGKYAAHLHEEVVIGAVTGPKQDWRDPAFEYVDPATFYRDHGIPAALIDRLTRYDGR